MLLGRQEPTLRTCPAYSTTYGSKAAKVLELANVSLLPWQRMLLDDWMAYTPLGEWVNSSAGAEVQRQNGKTYAVAGRIAAGMLLFSEWCVYTSHLQKTSTETFETLRDIFDSPKLKKHVKEIRAALGREEIVLNNGARCKFLARTRNGGRGQHGDLWVVDEAQELTDEQQGSFLPLLAASKRPQTIYIGTPPDENAPGEVFTRLRENARAGRSERSCWAEWSVDDIGDTSDRQRWADTNPSMGYIIKESTIEGEHEQMSPERFARERLGWWSKGKAAAVLPRERWKACAIEDPPSDGVKCFSAKFSPDGESVAVCVALKPRERGKTHFELVHNIDLLADDKDRLDGVPRNVPELAKWMAGRKGDTSQYVIDGVGSAENLRDAMVRLGVSKSLIKIPRPSDMAAANNALLDSIRGELVTYYQDEDLDAAAYGCSKRKIGTNGGWGFRSEDGADASILEAAALALWGVTSTRRDPKRKARMAW